jgi:hypothetical protein
MKGRVLDSSFANGFHFLRNCRAACTTIWPQAVAKLAAHDRNRLLRQLSHKLCANCHCHLSHDLWNAPLPQLCRKPWHNCHFWGAGEAEGSHMILMCMHSAFGVFLLFHSNSSSPFALWPSRLIRRFSTLCRFFGTDSKCTSWPRSNRPSVDVIVSSSLPSTKRTAERTA